MFHVITGGSGSGKSAYAEEKILALGEGPRIYIATMYPFDEESRRRIERHRKMRAEKNFETVECYTDLTKVRLPADANVLLECMSNLVANEMFREDGAGEKTVSAVRDGILHLCDRSANLIVVTNEIFSDGMDYDPETVRYQAYLGEINVWMAQRAARVTEVVYGIPLEIKRELL